MTDCNRRRFLSNLGLGAAAASWGGVVGASRPTSISTSPPADLEAIAKALGECSTDAAMATAVGFLRRGSTWEDLLGATLLLAVHDVKPQPIGNRVHSIMMVEPAFQMAAAAPAAQRMLPVLFNLDYVKRSQHRDGGWSLAPLDEKSIGKDVSTAAASKVLDQGMREWHAGRVDRGIAALYRATAKADLFEQLWPWAVRDFRFIGHKIIYAAAAYRVVDRIGWAHALPVLRSLGLGLIDGGGSNEAWTATFASNQKLAPRLESDAVDAGQRDPKASAALLAQLRTATVEAAAPLVVERLNAGLAPASVWDGYRLFAAELLMRLPGIAGVHPTTTVNAMHFAWRVTRRPATRRLIMLQTASWLGLFRAYFMGRRGMTFDGPGIDALRQAPRAVAVDATFDVGDADRIQAARRILRRAAGGGQQSALEALYRRLVFTKGRESHRYKYAGAMLEEYRLCHPQWAPFVLAAGAFYLPTARDPDAPVYTRAREALGN